MNKYPMWHLLTLAAALLLFRCAAVTATAKVNTTGNTALCATDTLATLGYVIVDANEDGIVKAQREKHAPNPFTGQSDADRITILIKEQSMRVLGETVHASGSHFRTLGGRQPRLGDAGGTPYRWVASHEVRNDVATLVQTCGG
jgi:hypothetical protein